MSEYINSKTQQINCKECICKNCPENKTFFNIGKCLGCDECSKVFLCLITG